MHEEHSGDSVLETWGLGISLGAQLNVSLGPRVAAADGARPLAMCAFDATTLPPEDAHAAWIDYQRAILPFDFRSECRAPGTFWSRDWAVDRVTLCDGGHPATYLVRRPRHAPGDAAGYVTVRLLRAGRFSGLVGDQPFRMTGHEVHLFDAERPLCCASDSVNWFGLRMPYDAIGYDPARHPAYLSLAIGSAGGLVVAEAIRALAERLPSLSQEAARPAVNGLVGLLRATLRLAPTDEPARLARREAQAQAMRRWAGRQLNNAAFGAAQLQARFDADAETVADAFEGDGGLGAFLSAQRLDAALRMIASGHVCGEDTGLVAARVGLTDPLRFTRAFEARFGILPQEVETLARLAGQRER